MYYPMSCMGVGLIPRYFNSFVFDFDLYFYFWTVHNGAQGLLLVLKLRNYSYYSLSASDLPWVSHIKCKCPSPV